MVIEKTWDSKQGVQMTLEVNEEQVSQTKSMELLWNCSSDVRHKHVSH